MTQVLPSCPVTTSPFQQKLVRACLLLAVFALPSLDPRPAAADGDIDLGFANLGRGAFDPYPTHRYPLSAQAFIRLSDGRLLIAGTTFPNQSSGMVAARFSANGIVDTTFGNGGIVGEAAATRPGDRGRAALELTDGNIVVAGSIAGDAALWNFDSSGLPDRSFGSDGIVTIDLGGDDFVESIVETAAGGLALAVSSLVSSENNDFYVVRLDSSGVVDDTFGTDGVARIAVPGDDRWEQPVALARDAHGNFIVAGNRYGGDVVNGTGLIARLVADGDPDPTFGDGGRLQLSFGEADEKSTEIHNLVIGPQGDVTIAGGIGIPFWGLYQADGFLARISPAGTLDESFGTAGLVRVDVPTDWGHYESLAISTHGDLAVLGFEFHLEDDRLAGPYLTVTRFNYSGTLDTDFGAGGTTVFDFGTGVTPPSSFAADLLMRQDGSVIVAGAQDGNFLLAATSDIPVPGYVGFALDEREVDEDSGTVSISVRRTGGSTGAIGVSFQTENGTAVAGSDYTAQSGRLEWADGEATVRSIVVSILDDDVQESARSFGLRLSNPSGGSILAADQTRVWIVDEDSGPLPPPSAPPPPGTTRDSGRGGGSAAPWWLLPLLLAHRRRSGAQIG